MAGAENRTTLATINKQGWSRKQEGKGTSSEEGGGGGKEQGRIDDDDTIDEDGRGREGREDGSASRRERLD